MYGQSRFVRIAASWPRLIIFFNVSISIDKNNCRECKSWDNFILKWATNQPIKYYLTFIKNFSYRIRHWTIEFEKFCKNFIRFAILRKFACNRMLLEKRNRMLFCHISVCDTTMFAIRPTRGYIIKIQLWNSFNSALIARTLHRFHVIGIPLTVVRIHFTTQFAFSCLDMTIRSTMLHLV